VTHGFIARFVKARLYHVETVEASHPLSVQRFVISTPSRDKLFLANNPGNALSCTDVQLYGVKARRKRLDTREVSCGKNTEPKAVVVSCYGYSEFTWVHENHITKVTMLCATLRRRRCSLDSLEDYRLLAPAHRCSSCGRKYSRSKQILSKVRKLVSQNRYRACCWLAGG